VTGVVKEDGMAWQRISGFGVIAVGLDESPGGLRAVEWAALEALRRGSSLRVITVWDRGENVLTPVEGIGRARRHQEVVLEGLRHRLHQEPEPAAEFSWEVVPGCAVEVLVEASGRADLLVMGSLGRGPVRSFLLGSVGRSVLRQSLCPVAVLPPETPRMAPFPAAYRDRSFR
jgi:nucleotide-binding universal stress UspA family protein